MSNPRLLKQQLALALILFHVFGIGGTAQGAVLCVEADGHASVEYVCGTMSCENLDRWHDSAYAAPTRQIGERAFTQCMSCVDFPLGPLTAQNRTLPGARVRVPINAPVADALCSVPSPEGALAVRRLLDAPVAGDAHVAVLTASLRI
ncbi:MAG: hypothetical protein HZB26_08720 [Candidatus Hydrogenedentes bacterium]|nr:hypothetical protein [Candidatus Hydrogenedentota bacterium]